MILGEAEYSNNSLIAMEDIGSNSSALICLTPFSRCCQGVANDASVALGDWYLPSGIRVENRTLATRGFGTTRSSRLVLLHQGGNVMASRGIFTCQIPVDRLTTAVLYAGLYPSGFGEFILIGETTKQQFHAGEVIKPWLRGWPSLRGIGVNISL